MTGVIITAEWMGFVHRHPVPFELLRHCAPDPAKPETIFKCCAGLKQPFSPFCSQAQ